MMHLRRQYVRKHLKQFTLASCVLALVLTACNFFDRATLPDVPEIPIEIPDLSDIPGIPDSLSGIPGMLEELGVPDLSNIANLPDISSLPIFKSEPGTINLRGPTDKKVGIGERIPGTDIDLIAITDGIAEFNVNGLRLERTRGDSLDFDGSWPGVADVTYNLRLRIYNISSSTVRAAGVQQLVVSQVQPVPAPPQKGRIELKFPHAAAAGVGELIEGTTFGYVGTNERGAEISGLPAGDYPYRKSGDSITWTGLIRADIPVAYRLRVLLARDESINVGGTVAVYLP